MRTRLIVSSRPHGPRKWHLVPRPGVRNSMESLDLEPPRPSHLGQARGKGRMDKRSASLAAFPARKGYGLDLRTSLG
jgi:hypothetical protein